MVMQVKRVVQLKQQLKLVGSMKKSFLFALLCGMAMASCETNNVDDIQENTAECGKRTFTILSDNSETRAVFNGTNGSLWKATDKIGVACTYGRYGYVTDETIQPFAISNAGGAETVEVGEFTGALTDKGSKTYVYYAYTPYSEGVSTENLEEVPCVLPTTQYPTATSWDSESDYMVAYPVEQTSDNVGGNNDLGFRFTRVFGMLRLSFDESWTSLYGDKEVKSVTITAGEDDKLAGDFTLDIMNEPSETSKQIVRYTMSDKATNSITLDYADKNILFKDLQAYFMLNSGTYANVEIKVVLEGVAITANRTNLTITRGALLSAPVSKKTEDGIVDTSLVEITTPGTLSTALNKIGVSISEIAELKIIGSINGTDIKTIRSMSNLIALDLSGATIVSGGIAYYNSNYTSSDVIGKYMFYNMANLQKIVLPDSITSIEDNAFNKCSSLASINIPNKVRTIGESVFNGCSSLPIYNNVRYADTYAIGAVDKTQTSYTLKENTRFISSAAFQNCSKVESFTIPGKVRFIDDNTFYGCSRLTNIYLHQDISSIGNYAFYGCSSLTKIIFPIGLTSIGEGAFNKCSSLNKVSIPPAITSIEYATFSDCLSLSNITLPNAMTKIGMNAFSGCSSLTDITLPDGITYIGRNAFDGCGLTYFAFPKSLTTIGDYALGGCPIETLICNTDNPFSLIADDDYSYYTYEGLGVSATTLSRIEGKYASADNRFLVVGGSLYAFAGKGLSSPSLTINKLSIQSYVFSGCEFKALTLNNCSLSTSAMSNITLGTLTLNSSNVTAGAVSGKIDNLAINNGCSVYYEAFDIYCKSMYIDTKWVDGDWSDDYWHPFYYSQITEITFGPNVEIIGEDAFSSCFVETVYCESTTPPTLEDFALGNYIEHIYVPYSSVDTYRAASEWERYSSLIEGYSF